MRYFHPIRLMVASLGLLLGVTVHAAPVSGLAVVCQDSAAENQSFDKCPASAAVYKTPAASDLVRDCGTDSICWTTGDVYRKFSAVAVGSTYDSCTTPLEENTKSPDPWMAAADLCKSWKARVKIATNTNGTINLSWDPVLLCIDDTDGVTKPCNDPAHPEWAIKGYRVHSGTSATSLTLLQTTTAAVTSLVMPGYGNGTYFFAVQAFNSDPKSPNSEFTPAISVTVAKPVVPTASGKPKTPGPVRATVTYPP
jgi:hypothetical protein